MGHRGREAQQTVAAKGGVVGSRQAEGQAVEIHQMAQAVPVVLGRMHGDEQQGIRQPQGGQAVALQLQLDAAAPAAPTRPSTRNPGRQSPGPHHD